MQRCFVPFLCAVAVVAFSSLWGCSATVDSRMESRLTGIERAVLGVGNQANETNTKISAVASQIQNTQNDLSYATTFILAGASAIVILGVGALVFLGRTIRATLDTENCKYVPTSEAGK